MSGAYIDHLCELPEHHPGPDATLSVPDSVKARDAWEAANPNWQALSKFDDPFEQIVP